MARRGSRPKPAVRLNAKPTKPHGSKRGRNGYSRLQANRELDRLLQQDRESS